MINAENFQQPFKLRAIKEILIKGGDRDALDAQRRRPIDLLLELSDDEIKQSLDKLLHKLPFYMPCCHLRQPMRKIKRSFLTLYSFLTMHLSSYAMLLFFVFPRKSPTLNNSD